MNSKYKILLASLSLNLCASVSFASINNSIELSEPAKSMAEQAKKAIAKGATVIDVRSAQEFATGHIKGAINIPHTEIANKIAEIKKLAKGKDTQIVVYCKRGGRAAMAEKVLRKNGFSKIINGGGYTDIKSAK